MITKNGAVIAEKPEFKDEFLYEVLRYEDGVYLFFEDHINRLKFNLEKCGKFYLFEKAKLCLNSFIPNFNRRSVMLIVDRDDIYVTDFDIREVTDDERAHGVDTDLYEFYREEPELKIYRKKFKEDIAYKMEEEDLFEFLLVRDGAISEGSRSNFYYLIDGILYEPPKKNSLPGVVKKNLYKLLKEEYSIEIRERELSKEGINNIDGAMLSGTGMDVVPIKKIGGKVFSGKDYEFTLEIAKNFREYIEKYKLNMKG